MENITNIKLNYLKNNDPYITPFSSEFNKYIEYNIDKIFLVLNNDEKKHILDMTKSLVTLIFFRFNFESENQYLLKLSNDNDRDMKMIIMLLFPHISSDNDFEIHKNLYYLKDISVKDNIYNKYITTIQYDRSFFDNNSVRTDNRWTLYDLYNNYLISFHTIYKCAHHLYCEWNNIIPLTLDNYQSSYIYKSTKAFNLYADMLYGLTDNNELKQVLTYSGLDVRDIYHVCINDLFNDIIKYKWLIYEKYDYNNNKDVMYIEELYNYFGNIFGQSIKGSNIYVDNKNSFINKWFGFIQLAGKDEVYRFIVYYILYNFHKQADNKIKLTFEKEEEEDEDENVVNIEVKVNELIEKYGKNSEDIYDYVRDVVYSLSKTWYGKLIFSDKITNKIVLLKDIEFNKKKIFATPIHNNSYISYKNIYNYIKSLLFNEKIVYIIKEYDGLEPEFKNVFMNRLNDPNNRWFGLSKVLLYKYGFDVNTEIIKNKISEVIKENFLEIIFHGLITRGILSEFRVKYNLKEKEDALNGYYFVTQQKYNELESYNESINELNEISFKDKVLQNKFKWTTFFAMDWLQQIHFYKHFFNQRVMYITGGTGVGKSTQIPKLLWYGLYLIGVYDGKIVNTQPRVNAATNNAERISSEMGVPIRYENYTEKKADKTDNYYIQYETEKKKHISSTLRNDGISPPDSTLNIVTDGTLLVKLKSNTYLKVKRREKYTTKNLYDIVSIDEAHEHNSNMDLILTLMRDAIQINNSVRLVIITATIDDDEINYRRYYKYINDNLLAPLTTTFLSDKIEARFNIQYLYNNVRKGNPLRYDRISLDRRVHISKPSGDTMFKITEEYTKEDVNTYEESQELGIIKTKELVKNADGDILFFSTSTNKINEIVTNLNNSNMPSNWIALPYYAQLTQEWLDKVNNIGKAVIEVDRKDLLLVVSNSNNNYRKVNKNQYNRYIIVATNVAEASITIESLKYVIETGWQVSVYYDPKFDVEKNETIQITESSRKQRKGRVGRTGPGTVYYMYKERSREKNIKKFAITLKMNELIYDLCELLSVGYYKNEETEVKDELLFNINPDNDNTIEDNINNLDDCVRFQYLEYYTKNIIYNKFYYGYGYGNYNRYTIKTNNKYCYKYKLGGYDIQTIFDDDGNFFLIHPFENQIKRNEYTGEIINLDKNVIKTYENQFNQLFKLRFIVVSKENNTYIKTALFSKLQELLEKIRKYIGKETTYSDLLVYILGNRYNLNNEITWINTIIKSDGIETLSQKITTKKNKEVSDNKELIKNFGDTSSDLNIYVNILNKVKMIIGKLENFNVKELEFESSKEESSIIDKDDFELIQNIEKKDKQMLSQIKIIKNKNKIIDIDRINKFCDYYGLDSNVLSRIVKGYIDKFKISNMINNWVIENNKYIPYFNIGVDIRFIYFSVYSNLNNIDDTSDIKTLSKDPNSIVTGKYIHSIRKIQDRNNIIMIHMSNFNPAVYTKAIIPSFIYPLKYHLITPIDAYQYYRNITPDMLEEYLLPEEERNNKIYNNELLQLFSLFRKN